MRYVRIPVSRELLERALRLPPDMKLVAVASTKSTVGEDGLVDQIARVAAGSGTLDIVVEHLRFKECESIPDAPRAEATLVRHTERIEWKFGEVSFGDGRNA